MRDSFLCTRWRCFCEEWKRERRNIREGHNIGYILPALRYTFAFFYMLSPTKWISGTLKRQTMIERGNCRPYLCIDIYVTCWVVIELASIGILCLPLSSILAPVIIGVFSYRLFDIFQSWVGQFVLRYKWEAINANRALVLSFIAYFEIAIIGTIVRFICQYQLDKTQFCKALYSSVMAMIANPNQELVAPILYAQIMFSILFLTVVVQQVLARISKT